MTARTWLLSSLASAAVLTALANGGHAQTLAKLNNPAAVVDGTEITMAEVEAVLKQAGPTATPLTETQRKQMQLDAVNMLIDDQLMQRFLRKNGPKIDPVEIDKKVTELADSLKKQGKTLPDFYQETGQTAAQLRINILNMLQWAGYVKDHVTDADVKRYYDENRDFFDRVMVRASHIVVRVSTGASESERQPIRAKLQSLRREILTGKIDFAEAAKKNSQCASAPAGGDIGYFPRKMAVEEPFAKAAFALKVGEISEVVQTDYGMHLIKATDRKAGQPSEFSKMKEEVLEFCTAELRMALLAQQRKTARIEIKLQ